jgi:REP element-mobilizing transposase RayT
MAFSDRRRRSIRLRGYDYAAPGAYFLTLCTEGRERLFGRVVAGRVVPSPAGRVVVEEWLRTPDIRREVVLDEWIVMPDHMHAIVIIRDADAASIGTRYRRRGDRPVAPTIGDRPAAPTVDATVDDAPSGDVPVGDVAVGDLPVAPTSNRAAGGGSWRPAGPAPASIGALVAGFKAASAARINAMRGTVGRPVWQRNYYERVIRSERELDRIRRYIAANPARWAERSEGPGRPDRAS